MPDAGTIDDLRHCQVPRLASDETPAGLSLSAIFDGLSLRETRQIGLVWTGPGRLNTK